MQARNPKYTASNDIDLEINHPQYGWIPFTASPNDAEAHGRDLYAQAASGAFGPIAEYVPPPPPPPAPPPSIVTMRQARLALHRQGLLDQVDAAITNTEARIEWEYATTVDRNSPLVQHLSQGLGLTESQMDALFTLAATL